MFRNDSGISAVVVAIFPSAATVALVVTPAAALFSFMRFASHCVTLNGAADVADDVGSDGATTSPLRLRASRCC